MECTKCTKCNNIAQIPYIEHKKRMFKAYQREMRLTILLMISNLLWLVALVFVLVR